MGKSISDVAIGYVNGGTVNVQFMNSLLRLVQKDVPYIGVRSGPFLSQSRNTVVRSFLENTDREYLMMVDTDIEFSESNINMLLEHDEPAASGLYALDNGVLAAGFFEDDDLGKLRAFTHIPEEPTRVDYAGCGFLLVSRDALLEIENGWFNYIPPNVGEDVSFCWRLWNTSSPLILDPRVQLGHVKLTTLYPSSFYGN